MRNVIELRLEGAQPATKSREMHLGIAVRTVERVAVAVGRLGGDPETAEGVTAGEPTTGWVVGPGTQVDETRRVAPLAGEADAGLGAVLPDHANRPG